MSSRKDWFRPAYLVLRSSATKMNTITVDPGEVGTVIEVEETGNAMLLFGVLHGGELSKVRVYPMVDGVELWYLWMPLSDLVIYWRNGNPPFRVLYHDPVTDLLYFEWRLDIPFLESFKVLCSVDSTATSSKTLTAKLYYTVLRERREPLPMG